MKEVGICIVGASLLKTHLELESDTHVDKMYF